jgi:phosphate starvation-inducible protein PhoH and related proteins
MYVLGSSPPTGSRFPSKTSSAKRVGDTIVMKGKSKHRARDRDMWPVDSEDELFSVGRSPSSHTSSYMLGLGAELGFEKSVESVMLKPRNAMQELYLKALENKATSIVVGTGASGCGKTAFAVHVGIQKLLAGEVTKLVLTRPVVSVDEDIGFLPGTLEEKMDPWMRPIYDVFYQYFTSQKLQQYMSKQVIEICPLAFMRGRTFENAWIVADEFQNSTVSQMLMLLTRIGAGSKLCITGDPMQFDRGFEVNGLQDLMDRIAANPSVDMTEHMTAVCFGTEDVQRHPVIKKILKLYT